MRFDEDAWTTENLRDPVDYRASNVDEEIDLDMNSTSGEANCGKSSADVQMRVLQRVIAARRGLATRPRACDPPPVETLIVM